MVQKKCSFTLHRSSFLNLKKIFSAKILCKQAFSLEFIVLKDFFAFFNRRTIIREASYIKHYMYNLN